MRQFPRFPIAISAVVLLALLSVLAVTAVKRANKTTTATNNSRLDQLPTLILWAWERPEKLDYLDPAKVGVAFLSKTIYLRADRTVVRPRLQPLSLAEDSRVIAVARIESDSSEPPTLTPTQMKEVAREIAELSRLPRVVAVQVDFDARLSEREFYRRLLFELREKLPKSTALTITALASWCKGDNWLEDLPIDEAVPMLFRMGVERNQILSQLTSAQPFKSSKCQASVGISTDEAIAELPKTDRVYVFNPKSWSPASVQTQLRIHQHEQQAP